MLYEPDRIIDWYFTDCISLLVLEAHIAMTGIGALSISSSQFACMLSVPCIEFFRKALTL